MTVPPPFIFKSITYDRITELRVALSHYNDLDSLLYPSFA